MTEATPNAEMRNRSALNGSRPRRIRRAPDVFCNCCNQARRYAALAAGGKPVRSVGDAIGAPVGTEPLIRVCSAQNGSWSQYP